LSWLGFLKTCTECGRSKGGAKRRNDGNAGCASEWAKPKSGGCSPCNTVTNSARPPSCPLLVRVRVLQICLPAGVRQGRRREVPETGSRGVYGYIILAEITDVTKIPNHKHTSLEMITGNQDIKCMLLAVDSSRGRSKWRSKRTVQNPHPNLC